ncbi:biogenesis of lysosome-related organelles complex 1 subunit 6 isoform X2 [Esox lucius]|uniref:BLOC-1 subunit 6 n=1 Tax=Esox lucius TaxID=8010 RepID=A0A3P8ZHW1_ESOLU|nr:biogenesis of lysosome-related organelles complex 1 subunit 6 isoform X2 [Esox lucius]
MASCFHKVVFKIAEPSLTAEDSLVMEGSQPAEDSLVMEGSQPAEDSLVVGGSQPAEDSQVMEGSQPAEESVLVEEPIIVGRKAIEKLTEGLLSHYLPNLHRSKQALQELTQNQVILLDTLDQEVTKFRECNSLLDLNSLFTEAKFYHSKLVNIRKDMIMLHEKTTKMKKRALKLQQLRQREALEKEQQREKELERERQLIAKPAKRTT